MSDDKQHWCATCGTRGPIRKIGQQFCEGTKRDKWLQKSIAVVDDEQRSENHALGHLRMMSGQVVWCDRCGAYGTHRGCGLAHPCPGRVVMGAGGVKWQRLLLLREGRHPKDKSWIGAPLPESAWGLTTVSNINTALTEVRKRNRVIAQKAVAPPSSSSSATRLELVRQRIKEKELAASGRLVAENRIADSSSRSACTGMPALIQSRFEALGRRIQAKETHARGGRHVNE